MTYTFEITLDFGVLGEQTLDVVCVREPGEKGVWKHGKQVEPDFADGWSVFHIRTWHANFISGTGLMQLYETDPQFRETVDDAVSAEATRLDRAEGDAT